MHGYFGISRLEPSWNSLKIAPQPAPVASCSLTLPLPGGPLSTSFYQEQGKWYARLESKVSRRVELRLPDGRTDIVQLSDSKPVVV